MNPSPLLSFWLLPSREEREALQTIICQLAQQYESVKFCPHLTLFTISMDQVLAAHLGGDHLLGSDRLLMEIDWETYFRPGISSIQPLSLVVQNIYSGSEFSKTVFIRLNSTPTLLDTITHLRRTASKAAPVCSPVIDPHISLIYQTLDVETKDAIARSIDLPQAIFHFNEIQIRQAPSRFESSTDVKQLQCLYSQVLPRSPVV